MNNTPAKRASQDGFRTFVVDVHGRVYYQTVSRLAMTLAKIPAAQRGNRFCQALSFVPADLWGEEMSVGHIRALISDCLQRLLEGPVPILQLRNHCAERRRTMLKRFDGMLRVTTVWGVHFLLIEMARTLLHSANSRGEASKYRQLPGHKCGCDSATIDYIARAWPRLAPHVREAVMTLVTSASSVESDNERGVQDL